MLKFILFGIGLILAFEGLVYFLFAKSMKNIFHVLSSFGEDKIKSFSLGLFLTGIGLIYFTFRLYDFS